MVKNYVLDTNVLIHDPESIYNFEDNNVIIPLPVLEELDSLKRRNDSIGRSARHVVRELDTLRQLGDLSKGVKLKNGGTLIVMSLTNLREDFVEYFKSKYIDNWILAYVVRIKRTSSIPTILVTKDISLRVKASALNIQAQDYLTDRSNLALLPDGYKMVKENISEGQPVSNFRENEYLKSPTGYFKVKEGKATRLSLDLSSTVWGIQPLNEEQLYAMDAMMDDSIALVTMVGSAGTGKTLIALACALEKTVNQKKYRRIIAARPLIPMGKDVGYLPGSLEEKLEPWMQPIMDNLEFLFDRVGMSLKEFLKKGIMEIEALSFIRGRTIPNQFVIIDEAQNLTPHEVKTILTRVGNNTKIVLTGDPYQIDTPYLDKDSNGLVYAASRLIGNPLVAHVTLKRGVRSPLASLAAERL
ncbi:phosphate starvation-inducible protein PhoH [Thermotoga sp. Ku-13t]|uniref:PhoH family protein n=1 Tax=Thermotoga sp. Ku-13t TaxID=1755813 RepID=UPI0013ED06F2|nr:PhoH family protein [Thermotoga sp. Ku-13t]KAF2958289.1 phosphate starvation-inducible protein PhoH [Thermotoga sp. Ku-13t]